MNKRENSDLMLEKMVLAANLYYKEKLSQQEIAKRLNVSRPWVSKLLSRAEELGIVRIEINSPFSDYATIENQLCSKYGLDHVGIVRESTAEDDALARAAGNFFMTKVRPNDIVGVGWGNAVSRFIHELKPLSLQKTQTVPLAGSFGVSFETLPNYNAMQMAEKLGGKANLLHVPAFCYSQEEHDTLLSHEQTREIISMGEHADLIIVGIGTFETSFLTRNEILSDEERNELQAAGAIGDVVLQFLTRDGRRVETDLTRRLIRADMFRARQRARSIIAFAEGRVKVPIIHAALTVGLVDAFFTDAETAQLLLNE